ncbi:MAG: CopG family transcriptional regulator [Oscillospiraceae bacterium]|nr:CopG family transcriptional regulator [Oscillospiraceae bacterium]
MSEKLTIIKRSSLKGDDGYKVFSIRIKDETVKRLDELSNEANRSRNELINIMLAYCIDHCEIKVLSDAITNT